ncbi:PAS domain-containing sensor histidine kinase, partial [bacterium]|nr:PAS domain-containing sensor histidine kinase [bacterium]
FLHAIRPTQPQLERCAVNEVLRDALVLLEHEIKDRDLLLETELTDALPPIRGDRAQLKQAFYNVIRNGIQAMQAGGILRVHSEATDTQVVVSVADTGGGIAPDQIGRLFEPYYTTKTKGTGLGLLIVQRIVREHGGTIDIQSDVGRGTTFQVRLPRQQRRTRLLAAAEPGAGRETTETRPDRRSDPSA